MSSAMPQYNFWSLIVDGVRIIAPEKICVKVWFTVSVRISVGRQFASAAIVLQPLRTTYTTAFLIFKSFSAGPVFMIWSVFKSLLVDGIWMLLL